MITISKKIEIEKLSEEYWDSALETNKEIMQEYLDNATHLTPDSLFQYTSGIRIFICYLNKFCNNKHFTEVESLDFLKYQNWLLKQGLGSSAIRFKRSCISNINNHIILFHGKEFPTFHNYITSAIKIPETPKKFEKIPLTDDEYQHLCDVLEEREEWQKLAYVKFTYISGCRRKESRQLLKSVVNDEPIEKMVKFRDIEGKEITAPMKKYRTNLIKCKGGNNTVPRRLSFDEDVLFYLNKWLDVRGDDDCEFMFVAKNGNKTKQVEVATFNSWCKSFESIIGRRMHPHNFRMSRASSLSLQNKSLASISSLLGHKSGETTKIYIIRDESSDEDEIFS